MNLTKKIIHGFFAILFFTNTVFAAKYFVHPLYGSDLNSGLSKSLAFKSFSMIEKLSLKAGDQIFLANGAVYHEGLKLINQKGTAEKYIEVSSIPWDTKASDKWATINFKGKANGVLIQDCSFIKVHHLQLTGNGFDGTDEASQMRCAILITNSNTQKMSNIWVKNIAINDVYFENKGFTRGKEEVHSANGTQKYGWGIRVISSKPLQEIENVHISDCSIADVSHTGIKLTGNGKNIKEIKITNNLVKNTGGPGIQMSGVKSVYVANNIVDHSGSTSDSRKWGRGSGLWTWGSSNVLIEKNQFLYANGPGDSAGAHIDYNCDNIFIQYNLSAYNAGGFCEILGNNYNCAYRYNVSINDGYRIKGENGAFQEGKTLWLSGFQGDKAKRKGPVNTYIYNNTIYCDATIQPKLAFDNTSSGILIANNIFHVVNNFQLVLGDQYKADDGSGQISGNVIFTNNLFLKNETWPKEINFKDANAIYGDVGFNNPKLTSIDAFRPTNIVLIKNKGFELKEFPTQKSALSFPLKLDKDILGHKITAKPSLGAIEPITSHH